MVELVFHYGEFNFHLSEILLHSHRLGKIIFPMSKKYFLHIIKVNIVVIPLSLCGLNHIFRLFYLSYIFISLIIFHFHFIIILVYYCVCFVCKLLASILFLFFSFYALCSISVFYYFVEITYLAFYLLSVLVKLLTIKSRRILTSFFKVQ